MNSADDIYMLNDEYVSSSFQHHAWSVKNVSLECLSELTLAGQSGAEAAAMVRLVRSHPLTHETDGGLFLIPVKLSALVKLNNLVRLLPKQYQRLIHNKESASSEYCYAGDFSLWKLSLKQTTKTCDKLQMRSV